MKTQQNVQDYCDFCSASNVILVSIPVQENNNYHSNFCYYS